MDKRHREIIDEYRNLICKNLIISEDFYRTLVTHGVFSEGLIKDVKKAPRGESQSQLLDILLTRTNAGFGKFCDVLEVTGHHFLSDCLREAENVESTNDLDVEDFMKKLPFVSKAIKNDQQKQAIQKYFKDKIHAEVVKQTWKGDISTKERLMVARQQQIEQIWHHEEESKVKDKGMTELQADYLKMQTRADDLRREIKSLHKHIEDMGRQHKEALNTQIKFNVANDRHLNRVNERAEDAGTYLADIDVHIRQMLGEDYYERQARTAYQILEENFDKVVKRHKNMVDMVDRFRAERLFLSNQVAGITIRDNQELKPHFQEFVVKNEEEKAKLETKLNELRKVNDDQQKKIDELAWVQKNLDEAKREGNAEFNSNLARLEKEVEATTLKIKSRDEKIEKLEEDIVTLTARLKDLEELLAEAKENERKARLLANQSIPSKHRTPPKVRTPPQIREQKPIGSHYKPKPTATRSTGVFVMDKGNDSGNPLEAIKGMGLGANDTLPPGVKSQGNVQAAVRQAANGTNHRTPKLAVNRSTARR